MNNNEKWMRLAFELAQIASSHDEVPVGAVLVYDNKVIGEGYNQVVSSSDPTAHAEIVALRNAGKAIGNYRLPGMAMYVTLEPCPMCAGALIHARIAKTVYAVSDPRAGACGSVFNLVQTEQLNHRVTVQQGVLEDECQALIQNFFKQKRI